jgi:anaerobic selenocysteine-containing dehydrogenase
VKAKFFASEAQQSNGHLLLIGRRQLRSNNSWMHNSERLVKGKSRCTILMNPADAAQRDFAPGQKVSVRSRVGAVVGADRNFRRDDARRRQHSAWMGTRSLGVQLQVAQQHAGESINDVTDNLAIDALCGTAPLTAPGLKLRMRMDHNMRHNIDQAAEQRSELSPR